MEMYSYYGNKLDFMPEEEMLAMPISDICEYLFDIKKQAVGSCVRGNSFMVDLYKAKTDRSDIDGLINNLVRYTFRYYTKNKYDYPKIKCTEDAKKNVVLTHVTLTRSEHDKDDTVLIDRDYDGFPLNHYVVG